ncbi:MAG TPA: ABC transporter ATP-binding protein, partial [Candidatus Eremiobacteraceae bacterium]|nr:ABC transporter ATP-binding protein [Candidatus Eremiobacteraceae bacterium]
MSEPVVRMEQVTKTYEIGDIKVPALRGVTFSVEPGEYVAVMGPSGSGKSTLMNLIGCLDKPTTGLYRLDGVDVAAQNDQELAAIRLKKLGFVFQGFNLLARTSAVRNVALPLFYAGDKDRETKALAVLDKVGLSDRAYHRPNELSGGQQQRVAIARALIHEPRLLVCDEPTAALDAHAGQLIMGLIRRVAVQPDRAVIVVTHDSRVFGFGDRMVSMSDGMIEKVETQEPSSDGGSNHEA